MLVFPKVSKRNTYSHISTNTVMYNKTQVGANTQKTHRMRQA